MLSPCHWITRQESAQERIRRGVMDWRRTQARCARCRVVTVAYVLSRQLPIKARDTLPAWSSARAKRFLGWGGGHVNAQPFATWRKIRGMGAQEGARQRTTDNGRGCPLCSCPIADAPDRDQQREVTLTRSLHEGGPKRCLIRVAPSQVASCARPCDGVTDFWQ